jgi:tetratricopeptide (TPR) repeat protein
LGVSLYEALTGRRPFEAPTREGLFQAILTREPPDPRALAPGISSDLKVVLETALAKEVGGRYATAHDLALDLRSASLGEPIRARPLSRGRRLLRWARRAPARAALVLLLALGVPALSSLGTYLLTARDEIAIGHGVLLRSRVDRAIDRGFMALLPVFGEAEPAFREALELDPGNLEATAGLTLYLLRLHERDQVPRLAEARVLIDQAEHRVGRHPDILRLRLLCAEAAGDGAQAEALRLEIGARRSALGCVIESTPCWSLAVAIPPNIGASKDLYRLASEACALAAPHRLYHYFLQGVAASTLKDPSETARIADVILDRWGDDPDACLAAAGVLMAPNNARARWLIEEKVLPFDAERPVAWVLLGLRGDSLAHITECIERGLELGGPNRWVLCRLGYARLSMGEAEAGLRAFQEALDLGQATSEELVGRGRARWLLGDLPGAEADFRSALGLWEGYYGAEYYLASLLMETGRAGEALPYLQRCIEVDDLQPESWRRLAQVLEDLGRDDEARATWERATQHLPGDPELWNSMAWFLIEPARLAEGWSPDLAAFAARCSLALTDPDAPDVLNTLGVALYRQGDDERALEVLRGAVAARAEKGLPQSMEDQAFIACAAARLGRREEAVMALEAARGLLADAPEDRDAEASLVEAEASVAAVVLGQPREQQ